MLLRLTYYAQYYVQEKTCTLFCTKLWPDHYRMEGNFGGGNVGELTRFEHLAKESLAN